MPSLREPLLYFVLLLCCTNDAFTQQSRQYSFKRFSVNDGLASNHVLKVVQDKDGYIWMATSNGLQRYDGGNFITFRPIKGSATSVPDVKIVLLFIDRKGNLWIMGDNKRTGIFDTRTFKFHEVAMPLKKSSLIILQGFYELPSGELVVLKANGNFLAYNPSANAFEENETILPHPKNWSRRWIHWDKQNQKMWMSCDSGLVQYDLRTKHLNYRDHNVDNDPIIKAFDTIRGPQRIFTNAAGDLIFVHWAPRTAAPLLYRYVRSTGAAEKFYTNHNGYHEIGYFLQQQNGRLWMYGMPFISEWTTKNNKPFFNEIPNEYKDEQSIRFDYMHDAFEDRQHNMWLSSDNGVYLFNPDEQIFNTHYITKPDGAVFTDAAVQSMAQLKDGRIFVGSWGSAGVSCYDKNLNPLPIPQFVKGDNSTWDMTVHPKTGNLWIGMQGGSVVVYDVKKDHFKRYEDKTFDLSTIRQVEDDTSGNIWLGTQNGKVIKWDYKKANGDPSKGYELVLQTGMVHKLHYDYTGYIWIATDTYGLLKLDARTGKVIRSFTTERKEGERLFSDHPTDMAYYNDSILLVAAGCLNIINTKTNKVTYVNDEDGLPSNTAMSVEKDKNGTIWIGMVNGLCRVNLEKRKVTYYDKRDGIANDKFNLGGVRELSDGRLVFFTDHNFMVFDPDKFTKNNMPPNPVITSFKLAGNILNADSLAKAGSVSLHHNNTSVSISFSALSYLQQNKFLYYYMMEGLDEDWTRTDKPGEITYNYLPPGNYHFRVKIENADGISNPVIAAIPINVSPPFWKTWWFFSLIALLVIVVLYLIDKERMRRRKALRLLRNEIRLNLKDEVSTGLNKIHLLSEMANMKAGEDLETTKGYIRQIGEQSRIINETVEDTVWSMDPANDSISNMLERMQEWTEDISFEKDVKIDFSADENWTILQQDMMLRRDVYILYKECIRCMIDNVQAQQLFVNWKEERTRMRLEIIAETKDNQASRNAILSPDIEQQLTTIGANWDVVADRQNISLVILFSPGKNLHLQ